ncbi:hypothetical protein B0H16DRAFT_1464678 [Mycena metata]|uniref:Uncharacterized protein n=1 Tax=Mycena metata TaxID=1033252 RepID=A0AAD7N266_9AGAR|nr:hypothetical protein B0H16DRAFT_1464678 [Mycena metata]
MVRFDGAQTKANLVSLLFRPLAAPLDSRRWSLLQVQFARCPSPVGWWLDGSAALSLLARKSDLNQAACGAPCSQSITVQDRISVIVRATYPVSTLIQNDARYTQDTPHRPPQVDEQTGRSSHSPKSLSPTVVNAYCRQDPRSLPPSRYQVHSRCHTVQWRRRQDSNIISITTSRGIVKTLDPAAPVTSTPRDFKLQERRQTGLCSLNYLRRHQVTTFSVSSR